MATAAAGTIAKQQLTGSWLMQCNLQRVATCLFGFTFFIGLKLMHILNACFGNPTLISRRRRHQGRQAGSRRGPSPFCSAIRYGNFLKAHRLLLTCNQPNSANHLLSLYTNGFLADNAHGKNIAPTPSCGGCARTVARSSGQPRKKKNTCCHWACCTIRDSQHTDEPGCQNL